MSDHMLDSMISDFHEVEVQRRRQRGDHLLQQGLTHQALMSVLQSVSDLPAASNVDYFSKHSAVCLTLLAY